MKNKKPKTKWIGIKFPFKKKMCNEIRAHIWDYTHSTDITKKFKTWLCSDPNSLSP